MPDPLEAEIEKEIVRRARADGWTSRKIRWVGSRNAPDRMFFRDDKIVIFEIKRPGKAVKGTQLKEFLRLQKVYSDTYIVDSVEEGLRILDEAGWR